MTGVQTCALRSPELVGPPVALGASDSAITKVGIALHKITKSLMLIFLLKVRLVVYSKSPIP